MPKQEEPLPEEDQDEVVVAKNETGDCSLIRFGDGQHGLILTKSDTLPVWKFIVPARYGKPKKLLFCDKDDNCEEASPPFPPCGGWANPEWFPDGSKVDRWHACTPEAPRKILVDDCAPLKVPKKCRKAGRCD